MKKITRRDFIGNSASTIAAMAITRYVPLHKKYTPRLSFTTLGCPDWSMPQIVNFAAKNGYQEIELRGIMGELDLNKCPDLGGSQLIITKQLINNKGLKIICLGSSAHFHDADIGKRKINLDEAKKYIDLANKLDCPFIRVFPDIIPEGQERNETFDLVIKGLSDMADYAKDSKVSILMECSTGTSGSFVKADDLHFIMKNVNHKQVGLLWNPAHMWAVTKEPHASVYDKLKKYIRHTHIKDLKLVNDTIEGSESYDVLLGEGDTSISEAVKILCKNNYTGSYCCEWDKFWYKDIREPEIVFTHFTTEIKKYFTQ